MTNPLPVLYATPTPQAVAALVEAHYPIGPIARCSLLNRGFNDCYEIRTRDEERFVARVSGRRLRGEADVAAETAFIAYLDAEGVPVAAPFAGQNGALFATAELPQGSRPLVLFRHVDGRVPNLDSAADAHLQGVALARLHAASAAYPKAAEGRHRLDLDQLLHGPVAAIRRTVETVLGVGPSLPESAEAIAARLADRVAALDDRLTRIRCHGDCHGLNARLPETGPLAGQAVLFDFDDGGFGYLAYDLAVHLWAQVSFGRRRHAIWRAFDAGYRSARPVAAIDEAAIAIFVAIRHLWLIGNFADKTAEWGSENFTAEWLGRQLEFLNDWEVSQLRPRLL
ncbi:phosphotransferase [Jiella sp. MQZ9-1]|uniref:Phosphotransferase n=1 Tax=Jiella flava TaxID=2816857 RepID=A0A939FUK5_9HYPH|nr:phosphotransferase [Jiella flava]MBO0661812.1 phosphotransferase [Jiella flava]MCD2470453.1 phosphotransferase [Jiella flava]